MQLNATQGKNQNSLFVAKMQKFNVWGRLKSGSFEAIRHLFPDGIPLKSSMPTGVSEDGRVLMAVDLDRLTQEQLDALCGGDLNDFEALVIARKGIGIFAEDFCELAELS